MPPSAGQPYGPLPNPPSLDAWDGTNGAPPIIVPSTPVISAPTPTPGTTISAAQVLGFTVADSGSSTLNYVIIAQFADGTSNVVYSPATGLSSAYFGSFIPLGPGTAFVSRASPWPSAPSLSIWVSNTFGNTAAALYSWSLAAPIIPVAAFGAASSSAVPTTATVYGSDARTFLDLGFGPRCDPYFLIVYDPRIVMCEAIGRRLTMLHGALFYSLNDGLWLGQYINAALTRADIATIESLIQQECVKDVRVQSAAVTFVLVNEVATVTVAITGALGSFVCVFDIASISGAAVVQRLTFQ